MYVPRPITHQKFKLEFTIIIKLSNSWSERQSGSHISESV